MGMRLAQLIGQTVRIISVLIAPHLPDSASAYVDRYVAASGGAREAILSWLPYVAAARLAEDVPNEADGLMAMAGAV